MLEESVNFTDDLYSTVKTLMTQLFSNEYIVNHNVSRQKPNSNSVAKPKFGAKLYDVFLKIVKNKLPNVARYEITQSSITPEENLKKMQ